MSTKNSVLFQKKKRKTKVNVKVFATDKKIYKSFLAYQENGINVLTRALGTPSGEDVEICADEGTYIRVISAYGEPTHFFTDDSFSEKIYILSDHLLIKVPDATGRSGMFVIDSHIGTAHQMIRDICLAYGDMKGAEVSVDSAEEKEAAA